jgi:putative transposase
MLLSYSYRLYPTTEQRQLLGRIIEIHRSLYNDALTERCLAWKTSRKRISYLDQAKQLKAIRAFDADAAWVNFTSIQQTLRRLQKAFAGFFRRIKAGEKPGLPRYKGKGWFDSVCYVYGDGLRLKNGRLYVNRVGDIRIFQHREFPIDTTIKMAVIKRDNLGNWFVVFQIEVPDVGKVNPETSVGIDVGLEYFAALSNGEMIGNPRWRRCAQRQLAILQQRQARCKKGSCQYNELKRQIQQLHKKTTNQRKDFHHKVSKQIVDRFDAIFVEKLNVKGMAQGNLSKSIGDAGWSQFLFFTEYKAAKAGKLYQAVKASGTSQECPCCSWRVAKTLDVRIHLCPHCGYTVPRDTAAAQVIELRGLHARTELRRKVYQLDWSPEAASL